MAKLNEDELEDIISKLNRTLSGNFRSEGFDIDLNNPIHVDMESVQYPHKYDRSENNTIIY